MSSVNLFNSPMHPDIHECVVCKLEPVTAGYRLRVTRIVMYT